MQLEEQQIEVQEGSIAERVLSKTLPFGELLQIAIMSYGSWIGVSLGIHVIVLLVFSAISLGGALPPVKEVIVQMRPPKEIKKLEVEQPRIVYEEQELATEELEEEEIEEVTTTVIEELPPSDFVGKSDLKGQGVYDSIGVGGGVGGYGGGRRGGRKVRRGGKKAESVVMAGLLWLARHQNPDGSWGAVNFQNQCESGKCSGTGHAEYDVGLTGLALLAFTGAGYTNLSRDVYKGINFGEVVRKAALNLLKIQNSDGVFGSVTPGKFMYNQAVASYALTDLYGLTGNTGAGVLFKGPAQRAIDYLIKVQNPGKVWRYQPRDGDNDASVMGWCAMALKAAEGSGLNVPRSSFTDMKAYLDEITDDVYGTVGYVSKGGRAVRQREQSMNVAYQDALTAVGIMVRIFIDKNTKDERIKKGADLLIRNLPEWDTQNYGKLDYYYWFYASYALNQFDGPNGSYWNQWNEQMKRVLLENQKTPKDGCTDGSWDTVGRWCDEVGRVYATAINVLTLEVYYRLGIVTRMSHK